MKSFHLRRNYMLLAIVTFTTFLGSYESLQADPSKYPQFAQQPLADPIAPSFIRLDDLVKQIKAAKKPVIIDVRTAEEYREAHILGSLSAPLSEFAAYIPSIPKDRLVVLY